MRTLSLLFVFTAVVAACGGSTATVIDLDAQADGSQQADGSNGKDGSVDSGGKDGGPSDDAGSCTPPNKACTTPCPPGTVCLTGGGPQPIELGCTAIPSSCSGGVATCDCMASCFCPKNGLNKCYSTSNGLTCSNGAVSRREFKKDIGYISDAQRAELADEALSIPLATYRYKVEPADGKKHLGFIIDDQPENSPAVQSDRTHVDEYGYATMLLATVQQQQKQIDAMNQKLEALEKRQCH